MVEIKLGKVTFSLKEAQDFSWLLELGEPFAVFSQNDSGNVSFGVEKNGERLFVKYAGARTVRFEGDPAEAVAALRRAGQVYKDLLHPGVVEYVQSIETQHGLALVFRWTQGECLHAYWSFDEKPKYTHPDSPYVKFQALPLEKKQAAAEVLFDFLAFAGEQGYVAVDLYDGSLMYDFEADRLTICDIDFFEKGPIFHGPGTPWWGSSRFKAPEEKELGGVIDQVSNVYSLGKMILFFFAGEEQPDREHWEESEARWQVVQKAISPAKEDRFATVRAFWQAWKEVEA